MGDDRIDELLTKLQKLDPETYEKLSGQWMMAGTVFQYEIDEETKTWHTVRNYFAIIQGVIQDAISARGWGFTIMPGFAIVTTEGPDAQPQFMAEAATVAEAILTAYVAALEATR